MIDKVSIMNRARLEKRRIRDSEVIKTAALLFDKYKNESLFMSGVALYWAEGTRLNNRYRKYQLALTNSDSSLLYFYCKFLQRYFEDIEIKDWRVGLYLYPDINPKEAVSYWSRSLNIPKGQFIKPQILNSKGKQGRKLKFGVSCVYINSKDACLTMQTWIEAVSSNMRR
jgi:hypothetical protein